ncbi:hypothetical protein A2771_04230 [Candidatus Woesebacteria bacterium RIFCSPHIGHO2_01_FULL_38_26b]|uniref:Uncharacterized protein n=1 Tax=Candidatus Woesebacteria bacterium RIFCSPHIGHO2_01_FULL_38_26b TaxID=1802491 RepID=A0A1F7Y0W4_9BACT|nr:MAG: hypothetical protein A2771_04230 [Candidatus Woesebacteria bacterium RIFCSPHIGHO2_01_FULL_38_26b]
MAQWATLEVAAHLTEEFDEKNIQSNKNLLLRGKEASGEPNIDEVYIDEEFQKLKTAERIYSHALTLTGIKVMTQSADAEAAMSDSKYTTGYYFVSQAMVELIQKTKDVSQAITFLVKNPPPKLNDLRNPATYIKSLVQKL